MSVIYDSQTKYQTHKQIEVVLVHIKWQGSIMPLTSATTVNCTVRDKRAVLSIAYF
jgi:hypothetical protein